jgi:hypothetical protein
VIGKAAMREAVYASRTPASTSGENLFRSFEVSVKRTSPGFICGADLNRAARNRLSKADCA